MPSINAPTPDATTVSKGKLQLAGDLAGTAALPVIGANKVTAAKIEVQQAWQTPTLLNSWVDFGGIYGTGQYMKDSLGFVHLKGLIKSGTVTSAAFNLPAGYRPGAQLLLATNSAGAFGQLQVGTNGDVTPQSGSNTFFVLDNITFKAEA